MKKIEKRTVMNVFEGPHAMQDFLNPGKSAPTPLVELPTAMNPFAKEKVRIFLKLMYLTPLLNLKLWAVWNMLRDAEKRKKLGGTHTLVEASSGNTAFSLAVLAPFFGIRRVIAIVPSDIAPGKLELLRLSGAQLKLHKESPKESSIALARRMGKRKGFLNLGQYENETNPEAHERFTAEQIWKQTEGKITIFCAGLGTAGTIAGAREGFRKKNPRVTMVGVLSSPDSAVPGVRTKKRLGDVRLDWRSSVCHVEVGARESFQTSLALCRAGLLAGPSSGFALKGLFKFLETARQDPLHWKKLRNKNGEICAVVIMGDTPLPYLEKYSTHLDSEEI